MTWRNQLPSLLQERRFRTQADLVEALAAAGHQVDQAAISRELRALGAMKIDGAYQLAADPEVPVRSVAITAGGCLVVLHTPPAWANVMAQRIDEAPLEGVLGTIAGDDTVFVATSDARAAASLTSWLGVDVSEAGA